MIALSTAKKIMRQAKADGIRVWRAPDQIFAQRKADGLAPMVRGLPVFVRKKAPIETALHEIGHAMDARRGSSTLRQLLRHVIGRKNPFHAERAANRYASELLEKHGTANEVEEFRRHMAAMQRLCRSRHHGRPSDMDTMLKLPTKYRLVTIGGKQRFMFIFESPVRLTRMGNGAYQTPNGGTLEVESSRDGRSYKLGEFSDAPSPETQSPNGCWTYRAVSSIQGGQFARLKITA